VPLFFGWSGGNSDSQYRRIYGWILVRRATSPMRKYSLSGIGSLLRESPRLVSRRDVDTCLRDWFATPGILQTYDWEFTAC